MNKTLKKILICLMLIVIMGNFIMPKYTFAADDPNTSWIEEILGSVIGLFTWPIRMVALAVGTSTNDLTEGVAYSQGALDENGNLITNPGVSVDAAGNPFDKPDTVITPFDIFFNRVAILDVNFFNIKNDGTLVSNIRTAVAGWYYAMRNIAAAILLCVFIYVGIRMAISTVASDKAAYKKMLVDWICSLALIFILQYIMIFTFAVNEAFLKALSGVNDGTALTQALLDIYATANDFFNLDSIAATIVYCMLVAQTIGLFISYFNRMLKIAFLIIIAPLITLTYSMDKMGDGKAQALGTWLKEFVYTVLIQTFHCVIYMAFIGMALSIFESGGSDNNLVGAVMTMMCVKFTKDGEKILGKIFKFSDATSDTSLAVGMAASAVALQKAKGIGKGTRSAINGVKNFGGNAKNFMKNAKVDMLTAKNVLAGGMSVGAAKEAATATVLAATAAKAENAKFFKVDAMKEAEAGDYEAVDNAVKNAGAQARADGKSEEDVKKAEDEARKNAQSGWSDAKKKRYAYHKQVQQETEANKAQGMSASLAAAQARATVAQRARQESKSNKTPRAIKGAVGMYSKAKALANSSETLKQIGGMVKSTAAAGFGLAAGGMVYGATGNEFNSIALGSATYKGTKEFMTNSAKTLTNDTAQLFQAAGDKTAADAAIHASNIRAQSDVFEDGSKLKEEIDKAFQQIESELGKLSSDDKTKFKSTVKNIMDREIRANPGLTNEQLFSKAMANATVSGMISKAGIDESKLRGGIGAVADLQRDKVIYDNMKSAGDIGLTTDAMINQSIKTFENYVAADASTKVDTTAAKEIIENSKTFENIEVEKMSTEEIEANERKLKDQMGWDMAAMTSSAETATFENIQEVQEEYNRLQAEADKFAAERIDRTKRELEKQYQELMSIEISKLSSQGKTEVETMKNNLLNEYKSLVDERNDILSRGNTALNDKLNISSLDNVKTLYNENRRRKIK